MTDRSSSIGLDETHDPALRSWVSTANNHPDFPIQNLPLGVFSPSGGVPRAGVAIGTSVLDLPAVLAARLLSTDAAQAVEAAAGGYLNDLLGLGAGPRRALRARLSELLREGSSDKKALAPLLHDVTSCKPLPPAMIGDYTDFYVGIHHATNIGKVFRPDNPLLPNYKWVPIGYHGRASSIVTSGTPIRRPKGQLKRPDLDKPHFGPSERLDYELELGVWVGEGNTLGTPISIADASKHVAGFCLLNDWSARDMQAWEYQPLGPFLSKNFSTTISPWIITPEASKQIILTALIFVGNNAAGYLLIAFFISYGQQSLHLPPGQPLFVCTLAAGAWLALTLVGGFLGDKIGRVRTFQIGYVLLALWAVPMFLLIDSNDMLYFFIAAAVLTIPLGLTYGPQAALYAEMFPAKVRYSGVSVGYALGSILGGAFAATIAQWIVSTYGQSWPIGVYLVILSAIR
jgi:2-keto-4-pentenoate hydratase/2-oxohepta-3-ene-1,7-dioic acid hydratase in catechol pathway